MVPVVRHAEALRPLGLRGRDGAAVAAARQGRHGDARGARAARPSPSPRLGALGGVVTTPIINHPEVAIVGVNKIVVRPVWDGRGFIPRKMMNLSSSFDHRVVDGWDAAVFVQRDQGAAGDAGD